MPASVYRSSVFGAASKSEKALFLIARHFLFFRRRFLGERSPPLVRPHEEGTTLAHLVALCVCAFVVPNVRMGLCCFPISGKIHEIKYGIVDAVRILHETREVFPLSLTAR